MALARMIFVGVLSTAWCCSALADEPVTPAASAPVAGAAGAGSPAMAPPSSDAVPKPAPGFTPVATPTSNSNAVSKDYLLQPGDELQIAVWKETDLTADVFIRPDGGISFPLAGDLPAAGHTVADLTAMLEKRVRRYEPDAVVTVMVKAAIGNRVYVIGKVNRPGDFALNRPIDVMQALSLAGGATPFANTNHIRVLRRDGDHIKAIAFRYGDVQRGRRLDQNILLKSGDTVVVP